MFAGVVPEFDWRHRLMAVDTSEECVLERFRYIKLLGWGRPLNWRRKTYSKDMFRKFENSEIGCGTD